MRLFHVVPCNRRSSFSLSVWEVIRDEPQPATRNGLLNRLDGHLKHPVQLFHILHAVIYMLTEAGYHSYITGHNCAIAVQRFIDFKSVFDTKTGIFA